MTKEDKTSDTEVANESTESNEVDAPEEKRNGNEENENEAEEETEADPLSAEDENKDDEEGAEEGEEEGDEEDDEKDDANDDDYGSSKKKKAPKKKAPKKASSGKKGKNKKGAGRPRKQQDEEEEYEVQDIMGHKEVKGKLLYKIRWKGYGPSGDTWEPVDTLSCPEILDKYNKKNKVDGGKRKSDSKTPRAPPKKQKIEIDDEEDEDEDPEAEYEVERLIDVREKRNGSREFLVHWKGWSKKFETWEPEDNLNCQDLIEKFLEKLEKVKGSSQKNLRVVKKHTQRFTLTTSDKGRRISKRNSGKQRAVYFDADD